MTLPICSNYAPTIGVNKEAAKKGCQQVRFSISDRLGSDLSELFPISSWIAQVLWLHGQQEEVTEVGTMNIFVLWKNESGGEISDQNN